MKRVLVFLSFLFICQLSAEYLNYPKECSYVKYKKAPFSKKDVRCYIKWYAATTNRRLPIYTDQNTKLIEIEPHRSALEFYINFNHIKGPKSVGKKRWYTFVDKTKRELNKKHCSPSSKHYNMIKRGLHLIFIYKNMFSGHRFKAVVNRKSCGF